MKNLIFSFIFIVFQHIQAQTPDDALRASWFTQNGSARSNAIGGAIGSLGGDLTAAYINPAGIGLYRTKEFMFSVGDVRNNNVFDFRGTNNQNNKSVFRYGSIGFVFGSVSEYNTNKSSAFSITVNQITSFNNRVNYSGFNNYSSFSEQYVEELVKDKADTMAALGNYIFGSTLAFRTYLVDTLNDAQGRFIGYKSLVPISTGVNQQYQSLTQGGIHDIALTFATKNNNKWYFGGSINIPIISYRRTLNYREDDATTDTTNRFGYFTFTENFRSTGAGFGIKLGAIHRLSEKIRLGLAIHSPQFFSLKDRISASMTTNTEGFKKTISETSNALNNNNEGTREYTLTTPYRVVASASYVFNQVEDTRKQRGFLSIDVEFVNYRGSRFSKTNPDGTTIKDYYNDLNNTIKENYKPNINFKLGGEIKFDPVAFRLGFGYYGSPYKDDELKANRKMFSAGIGYRAKGMFIDFSYTYTKINDVNFPYRLADIANTFAQQSGNNALAMLTIGFKL